MVEQQPLAVADIAKLSGDKDLCASVERFIEGVSEIEEVERVIIMKFNDAQLRLYALWAGEIRDYWLVQGLWDAALVNLGSSRRDLPCLIQYPERCFAYIIEKSNHFSFAEKFVLWQREKDAV